MKRKLQDTIIPKFIACSVAAILVLVPYHAFLTVWASSGVGHYTALRLWKEVLLLLAGMGAGYLLLTSTRLRRRISKDWLWRLVAAYSVVTVGYSLISYWCHSVTLKAALYGVLLDVRPFAILLVAWVAASMVPWLYRYWQRLVLWPAAGVVVIGLLQYFVLPYDVMKHFGYNGNTIWPYETIDHKLSYIRVRSTLRGANLLGGYLLLILAALAAIWRWRRRLLAAGAMLLTLVCLYASGSRGAWLGAVVAGMVWAFLKLPNRQAQIRLAAVCVVAFAIAVGGIVALRNNDFVQNTLFHTDEHSSSKVSSNAAHIDASRIAVNQVLHEPFGRGPGTAGPAGVYNTGHPARIAENNFLQIGQETGWLGLALFVAIYALVARALWQRRQLLLAQVLLSSLAGLTVMALLMHIWSDDTIAYLWWGLAGIALAQVPKNESEVRPLKRELTEV